MNRAISTEEMEWLIDYRCAAYYIKEEIRTRGWARAKGEIKDIIKDNIKSGEIVRPGFVDATLDSVN